MSPSYDPKEHTQESLERSREQLLDELRRLNHDLERRVAERTRQTQAQENAMIEGALIVVLNLTPLPPEGDYKLYVRATASPDTRKNEKRQEWTVQVPAGKTPADARDMLRAAMEKDGWSVENGTDPKNATLIVAGKREGDRISPVVSVMTQIYSVQNELLHLPLPSQTGTWRPSINARGVLFPPVTPRGPDPQPIGGVAEIDFQGFRTALLTVTAEDGKATRVNCMAIHKGTPHDCRDVVRESLKGAGWTVRNGEGVKLIIEGHNGSLVKSIEITGSRVEESRPPVRKLPK